MASGKRSHPTASLGVLPEINTVHAFGNQGHETSGWPNRPTSQIGTPIMGTRAVYRPARVTSDPMGGLRSHPTAAFKLRSGKKTRRTR